MKKITFLCLGLFLCLGGNSLFGAIPTHTEGLILGTTKKLPVAKSGGSGEDWIFESVCGLGNNVGVDNCLPTHYNRQTQKLTGTYNMHFDFNADHNCGEELSNVEVVIRDENNNILGSAPISDAAEICGVVPPFEFAENDCSFSSIESANLFIPITLPFGCDENSDFRTIKINVELRIWAEGPDAYMSLDDYFGLGTTSGLNSGSCLDGFFLFGCSTPLVEFEYRYEEELCYQCAVSETEVDDPPVLDPPTLDPLNDELGGLKRMAAPAPENTISINPNPFVDVLNLSIDALAEEAATVEVYNIQGQQILSQQFNLAKGNNQFNLNTNDFQTGSYFVKVRTAQNSKIIKLIKSN